MPPQTRLQSTKVTIRANLQERCRASVTVEELIHEVSRLLELMTPHLLKKLAATSVGLHKQIHCYVTSIALPRLSFGAESHMHALVSGSRPMLRVLDLSYSNLNNEGVHRLVHGDWPMLTELNVSNNSFAPTALGSLARANWSLLTTLNLSGNMLTASALQSLSCADLPHLQTLDLSACGLDGTAMQCLAHAGWVQLKCLRLENNFDLDQQAAFGLTQANWPFLKDLNVFLTHIPISLLFVGGWPQLESLKLGFCYAVMADVVLTPSIRQAEPLQTVPPTIMWHCIKTLDWYEMKLEASTVTQLTAQDWQLLQCVRLMSCRAVAEEFENFMHKMKWPLLMILDLDDIELSESLDNDHCVHGAELVCSVLSNAHLFLLTDLNLSLANLGSSAMIELMQGDWTNSRRLGLSNNYLNASAVACLVEVPLPNLEELSLMNCLYENIEEAVTQLSKGKWHLLRALDVQANELNCFLDVHCVTCLLVGDWPLLENLFLSTADLKAVAVLLSGSSVLFGDTNARCWTATGRGPPKWPCLNVVIFQQDWR